MSRLTRKWKKWSIFRTNLMKENILGPWIVRQFLQSVRDLFEGKDAYGHRARRKSLVLSTANVSIHQHCSLEFTPNQHTNEVSISGYSKKSNVVIYGIAEVVMYLSQYRYVVPHFCHYYSSRLPSFHPAALLKLAHFQLRSLPTPLRASSHVSPPGCFPRPSHGGKKISNFKIFPPKSDSGDLNYALFNAFCRLSQN